MRRTAGAAIRRSTTWRILRRVADDVDDARREAGVDEDLADQAVQGRAQLGRFQDHRIAAGERHRDRARAEDDRGVPGRDADHHAAGLAHAHGQRAGHVGGNDFAADLGRHGGRLAQHVGRQRHVELVPHRGAAGFGTAASTNWPRSASILSAAFSSRARRAPGSMADQAGKASLRGLDGGVDVVQGGGGGAGGDFAGGGIAALEPGAVRCGAGFPAAQQICLEHQRSPPLTGLIAAAIYYCCWCVASRACRSAGPA
jgi:hypothetical protein